MRCVWAVGRQFLVFSLGNTEVAMRLAFPWGGRARRRKGRVT